MTTKGTIPHYTTYFVHINVARESTSKIPQFSQQFEVFYWMKGKSHRLRVMSYWSTKVRALLGQSCFPVVDPAGPLAAPAITYLLWLAMTLSPAQQGAGLSSGVTGFPWNESGRPPHQQKPWLAEDHRPLWLFCLHTTPIFCKNILSFLSEQGT